jgi:hypothetical protein
MTEETSWSSSRGAGPFSNDVSKLQVTVSQPVRVPVPPP